MSVAFMLSSPCEISIPSTRTGSRESSHALIGLSRLPREGVSVGDHHEHVVLVGPAETLDGSRELHLVLVPRDGVLEGPLDEHRLTDHLRLVLLAERVPEGREFVVDGAEAVIELGVVEMGHVVSFLVRLVYHESEEPHGLGRREVHHWDEVRQELLLIDRRTARHALLVPGEELVLGTLGHQDVLLPGEVVGGVDHLETVAGDLGDRLVEVLTGVFLAVVDHELEHLTSFLVRVVYHSLRILHGSQPFPFRRVKVVLTVLVSWKISKSPSGMVLSPHLRPPWVG